MDLTWLHLGLVLAFHFWEPQGNVPLMLLAET